MITAFNLWGQFQDRRLEFQLREYFWSKEQRLIQIGFVLISILALMRFLSDYILLHFPIKDIIAVRLILAGLSLFFAGILELHQ
ncbi:MAG: hypothetical protein HC921_00200 [Synechococcaceae cyanobacterium SM2_3_1]|nr:hypothetical protein [Synechococcaceae cyanobacterium SM2_3_1]